MFLIDIFWKLFVGSWSFKSWVVFCVWPFWPARGKSLSWVSLQSFLLFSIKRISLFNTDSFSPSSVEIIEHYFSPCLTGYWYNLYLKLLIRLSIPYWEETRRQNLSSTVWLCCFCIKKIWPMKNVTVKVGKRCVLWICEVRSSFQIQGWSCSPLQSKKYQEHIRSYDV